MPLTRTLAVGSRRRWQRLSRDLFDRGGLDELFGYARNPLTGTVRLTQAIVLFRYGM